MPVRFAALLLVAAALSAQTAPAVWIDVPFVRQPREGCGAASLSMVMQYWAAQEHEPAAAASDVAAIQRQLYVPKEHGIPAASMQSYLRQNGFEAFAVSGTWQDLEQNVRKGRPLIVALRPRGQTALHYVVIDGVDAARGLVMMNDPAERKLLTEERAGFEKDWSATHNWMLLAVPATPASGTAGSAQH
ncbi:MAG TPA: C39 family peptidase [Acidobacteriaceae bacterium]|nr:C39 family peptidase [Acidobacteriaceae bacterium]